MREAVPRPTPSLAAHKALWIYGNLGKGLRVQGFRSEVKGSGFGFGVSLESGPPELLPAAGREVCRPGCELRKGRSAHASHGSDRPQTKAISLRS